METTKKKTVRKEPLRGRTTKSSQETLKSIFEDLLKDIFWAEKHLVKALPKMAKAAQAQELKEAIENHLDETRGHVSKVEKCFELIEKKPSAKKCEAMEGLVKEGEETIKEYAKGSARDAAIIAAAQKVEHYEISAYGTLRAMADVLGNGRCAGILRKIEQEEINADEKLTDLAENVNQLAAKMDEESE